MSHSIVIRDTGNLIVLEKDGLQYTLDEPWFLEQYRIGAICESCGDRGAKIAMLHQNCGPLPALSENEIRRKQWDRKSKVLSKQVYTRDGFKCAICGDTRTVKLTIDHIKPLSKGGDNELANLRVLCKSCNSKKGNR